MLCFKKMSLHYQRWGNGAGVATAITQFILLILWCRDKCTDMFVVLVVLLVRLSSDPIKWNSPLHILHITVSDDLIRLLFSSTVVLKPKYCYTSDLRRGLLTLFVRKIVCLENDAEWSTSSILSNQNYTFIITMTSLLFFMCSNT